MIHRGCVTDLETLSLVWDQLIWLLKRSFTDTDMHDPLLREEMEDFYSYLKETERVNNLTIPSTNYDIVLGIVLNRHKEIEWSYYYACHETRCLFWLDKYDASYIALELDGVESPAHLSASRAFTICAAFSLIWRTEHRFESLYWYIGYLLLD